MQCDSPQVTTSPGAGWSVPRLVFISGTDQTRNDTPASVTDVSAGSAALGPVS